MSDLPQTNARLTLIAGGGFTEDYDDADAADTAKWQGDADAYFSERVLNTVGDADTIVKRSYLIIPSDLLPALSVEVEDTLTFVFADTTLTRKVAEIVDARLVGVPGGGSTRLYLKDA